MTDAVERKGLPTALFEEKLILGSITNQSQQDLSVVAGLLAAADFSIAAHRVIFARIQAQHEAGKPWDYASLARAMHEAEELEDVGGLSYLLSLSDGLPEVYSIDAYCQTVLEKAALRRAILTAQAGIDRLCSHGATMADVESLREELSISAKDSKRAGFRRISEIIDNEPDGRAAFLCPSVDEVGIPWPWAGLNDMIGFLAPGQVVVLAAGTGVGKTTIATQSMLHAATMGRVCAAVVLEMTAKENAMKIVAQHGQASLAEWMRGNSDKADRRRISVAAAELYRTQMYFDDRSDATPAMIAAGIERMDPRPAFLLVDYLQLMDSGLRDGGASREQHVAHISRSLKKMAKRYNMAVLALSQLNDDGKVRESRAIAQDATYVLKLIRKTGGVYHLLAEKARYAAAQRHVVMRLDGESGLFSEVYDEAHQ